MKMKHHWAVKLVALILVAVSAAVLAVSGCSVAINTNYGLYSTPLDQVLTERGRYALDEYSYRAAKGVAAQYLMEENTQPDTIEREIWANHFNSDWANRDYWPQFEYTIRSGSGSTVLASTEEQEEQYVYTNVLDVELNAGAITNLGRWKEFPLYDELPLDYQWTDYYGNELPELDRRTYHYDLVQYGQDTYRVEYFPHPEFQVQICLTQGDVDYLTRDVYGGQLITAAYQLRRYDIGITVAAGVALLASVLYLCFAGGKQPGSGEIRPRGTNRLPLDLFAVAGFFAGWVCLALGINVLNGAEYADSMRDVLIHVAMFGIFAACTALITVLFLMALCAQVRMGGGACLKGTVVGRCGRGICRFFRNLWAKLWGKVKQSGLVSRISRGLPAVWAWLRGLYRTMPLVWQWVLLYGGLLLLTLWVSITFRYHYGSSFILVAVVGFLLVAYTGHAFGKLRDAAKRMSQGDLNTKINTYNDFLYGNFAEFAQDLNALGDACVEAAMEKMKSERMKSELITNVSHDIKTPLTSIINYVDLLQRAQTQEQRSEYLEVLQRQSQRLKKLIEDLMEMSKANSGSIAVELSQTDVVEAVNQALGEFADRLAGQNLSVVFRQSEQVISANCDGKLLWRVMSNVLGNVVKYALPGTRVYVDVLRQGNQVQISLKNISRDPLNISVEELMERFVRGDQSRNSEGNGLGLNIARGLMEVQQGSLALMVDGDLFKVILTLNTQ